jgi:GNAT superfamily N-acetyltransferase
VLQQDGAHGSPAADIAGDGLNTVSIAAPDGSRQGIGVPPDDGIAQAVKQGQDPRALVARAAGRSELGIYTLGLSFLLIGFDMQNSVVLIPYTVFSPRHGEAAQPRLAGSALLHTLALSVAEANHAAARVYEKLGFQPYCAFLEGVATQADGE